jgi:hypothetical protein
MDVGDILSVISISTLLLTIGGLSLRDWMNARRDR